MKCITSELNTSLQC